MKAAAAAANVASAAEPAAGIRDTSTAPAPACNCRAADPAASSTPPVIPILFGCLPWGRAPAPIVVPLVIAWLADHPALQSAS